MTPGLLSLEDAASQRWDVIVIGTGVGGATLGHALARAGKRVLFCEKGAAHLGNPDALLGAYPEDALPLGRLLEDPDSRHALARAGRESLAVQDVCAGRAASFVPFIGCGTGGSSALYGMAMERFFPSDFTPRRNFPSAVDSTLPDEWPISYDELAPWYTAAEALYRVQGQRDPLRIGFDSAPALRPPSPATAGNAWLAERLAGQDLHPYRLPMACEQVPGCQGCQGYLCPRDCKNDSAKMCLLPALRDHGARLVPNCEVLRLTAGLHRIESVTAKTPGTAALPLRADCVVLAAGALVSPSLLRQSADDRRPDGLGNAQGWIGRNLMRHMVDIYAIRTATPQPPDDNRHKQLAFNDLYDGPAGKLGSVQSFGRFPPARVMWAALQDDLRSSAWSPLAALTPLVRPMLMRILEDIELRRLSLAATLEDLPYAHNRVEAVGGAHAGRRLHYRLAPHEQARVKTFRRLLAQRLRGLPYRLLKQAHNNQRIAHVCGTCRFGNSPATSVLDRHNRVHDLDNLFVVDASFFPSSGGTNPSLTIAANALRVAAWLGGSATPSV